MIITSDIFNIKAEFNKNLIKSMAVTYIIDRVEYFSS